MKIIFEHYVWELFWSRAKFYDRKAWVWYEINIHWLFNNTLDIYSFLFGYLLVYSHSWDNYSHQTNKKPWSKGMAYSRCQNGQATILNGGVGCWQKSGLNPFRTVHVSDSDKTGVGEIFCHELLQFLMFLDLKTLGATSPSISKLPVYNSCLTSFLRFLAGLSVGVVSRLQ